MIGANPREESVKRTYPCTHKWSRPVWEHITECGIHNCWVRVQHCSICDDYKTHYQRTKPKGEGHE